MKCCSIISGSSGNCVYLETDKTRILVDAGESGRKLQEGLKLAGIDPRSLHAIFVTHEHADHMQGVGVLSRRFRLPVFANSGTWNAMARRVGRIGKDYRQSFKNYQTFRFRDLVVTAFSTHHDAADPVGYCFESGGEKVSVVTDTGVLDDRMMDIIQGSQIYYFESNHDLDMLLYGPYPPELKKRIRSDLGHLSNDQAGDALSDLLRGDQETVILAHMSMENNEERICHSTVVEILQQQGFDTENRQTIIVAPRYLPSPLFSTDASDPVSERTDREPLPVSFRSSLIKEG